MKLVSVVVLLLLAPVLISCSKKHPVDCGEIHKHDSKTASGVYSIFPPSSNLEVQAYCDMKSLGGGWTVIQRRMDGSVNFFRTWAEYKSGFGCPSGEYWIGLDVIHHLANGRKVELLVKMEDFKGKKVYAQYTSFSVGPESSGYLMKVSGFKNGGAGDALTWHNGQKFSTYDHDQDATKDNCAKKYLGGFWYRFCHTTNPNGLYVHGNNSPYNAVGVVWKNFKGYAGCLKTISMAVRPL